MISTFTRCNFKISDYCFLTGNQFFENRLEILLKHCVESALLMEKANLNLFDKERKFCQN